MSINIKLHSTASQPHTVTLNATRLHAVQSPQPKCDLAPLLCLPFSFAAHSEIVYNTEYHIRIFELLLKGGDWGESLPDFVTLPGEYHWN